MLQKIKSYCYFGSTYAAVEHTSIDEIESFNLLILQTNKSAFETKMSASLKKQEEVFSHLKQQHLFLIVNNSEVLFKALPSSSTANDIQIVATAFPSLKIDDFYFEIYKSERQTFVAICRKNYVDALLTKYDSNNIDVQGLSLGVLVFSQLLSYLEDGIFETPSNSITIQNHEIEEVQFQEIKTSTTYSINGLNVENNSILLLAGILTYYTANSLTSSNFTHKIKQLQLDFSQKIIFKWGSRVVLGVLFVLLLFNALFFTHYNSKINSLNQEVQIKKGAHNQLNFLQKEVHKKEQLVNTLYAKTSSQVSLVLDKLGQSVPNTVMLSSIEYQPLLKNIQSDKKIEHTSNQILVLGTAKNSADFLNWIHALENQKWIAAVSVNNYGVGKRKTTKFELNIGLK